MNFISESLRSTVWFGLCVVMVVGMVIFAVVISVFSVFSRTLGFREFSFPNLGFAK